jgi:hypothetical protein
MGIAMTILSFAMLSRHTGIPLQEIHAPDFNLMAMWNAAEDKVMRVENRAVNDYEHIRLVYQLERRLEDLPASSRPECHGNARSIPPKFIPLGSAPTA